MVLAEIANGLGSRVTCSVLTRGYAGSPKHELLSGLQVVRYPNPAPESWKDYATGTSNVSLSAKLCVGILDVFGSVGPLRKLAAAADLVHLHFPLPLGLSALLARALGRRPLIVTVHGSADIYELPAVFAPLTKAVLRRADAVVSTSGDLREYLVRGLEIERAVVIPNGVDTELFRPVERAPSELLTLVSISRLAPRKNIDVLIHAARALSERGDKSLRLVIAGSGPLEGEIARLASTTANTTFLGFIDETRKRELLGQADAFVQFSTRQGSSIAQMEAMACGVPCLVSDLPGVREPVIPQQNGFLVANPRDVNEVAAALARLVLARSELERMRAPTRRIAEERYSVRAMADAYFGVYDRVLRGHRP